MTSKTIGTHDGKFHADEALACSLLLMTDAFKGASVNRSRDPEILDKMDIVVDVGGVYDPIKHRYDHHQKSFIDTFSPEHKTLLSSAGLIYKHFGREILEKNGVPEKDVDFMHRRLYESFVEAFDGNDNGIDAYPKDIKPLYQRPFNVFSHINLLNPSWNDNSSDPDSQFLKAVEVVGDAFRLVMNSQVKSWLPARQILLDAYEKPSKFDDRILVLDQFCPWTEHLHSLEFSKNEGLSGESSNNKRRPILYVLFADSMGRSWRVQAVPVSPESFENRNPLPEAWRGLRDDELDSVVGIKDCVFVHRSGFIGAHKTREGAIQMAISALPQTSK